MTLSCTLTPRSGPTRDFRGLNDVVLRAAPFFHLLEIGLSIDGESVMTYRGDGLILATPVGSTAHSLSAGGPILPPNAHMFVVTPLCAHTLTQRPLVDSTHKVYEMVPRGAGIATVLVIDGQVQVPVEAGDRVDRPPRHRPRSRWSASPATASTAPSATSSAGAPSPPATAGRGSEFGATGRAGPAAAPTKADATGRGPSNRGRSVAAGGEWPGRVGARRPGGPRGRGLEGGPEQVGDRLGGVGGDPGLELFQVIGQRLAFLAAVDLAHRLELEREPAAGEVGAEDVEDRGPGQHGQVGPDGEEPPRWPSRRPGGRWRRARGCRRRDRSPCRRGAPPWRGASARGRLRREVAAEEELGLRVRAARRRSGASSSPETCRGRWTMAADGQAGAEQPVQAGDMGPQVAADQDRAPAGGQRAVEVLAPPDLESGEYRDVARTSSG